MILTAKQVRTLARLVNYDAAPEVFVQMRRGETIVEWRDAAGVWAQMALSDEGKVKLPSNRSVSRRAAR